jgi:A/G-specific adenine glycosylase
MKQQQFTCQLMQWNKEGSTRFLPWKGEQDPYKIWLSEIILQQTRAEQGLPYYQAFVQKYPNIAHLAQAPDTEVFKLWEGLGYYSRCRYLLTTARYIVDNLGGKFPVNYEDILSLKGIGPYTAAAISSFAYNLPHAVVDGNVFRVLARCFGIYTPTDSAEGRKFFTELANQLLDKEHPAIYNQAIMDFGATVCKPVNPLCNQCPEQYLCEAYLNGTINELPVKEKKLRKKMRWFTYFIFNVGNVTLVHQRTAKDIWQNLYEFYLVETDSITHWSKESLNTYLQNQFKIPGFDILYISPFLSQQLTHQTVKAQFIRVELPVIPPILQHYQWINKQQIAQLAFPKIINEYLQSESFPATLF